MNTTAQDIDARAQSAMRWKVEAERWEAKAAKAEAEGRKGWVTRYRRMAEYARARSLQELRPPMPPPAPMARIVADSIIVVGQDIGRADMPIEEFGPCVVGKTQYRTRDGRVEPLGAWQVLGYAAAAHGGGFTIGGLREVFVLSDVAAGDEDSATFWAVNLFPTLTQARRAVRGVRWLPVLRRCVKDIIGIVLREWELAKSEGAVKEPLFVIWVARPEAAEYATEEFGIRLGEAVFGFAAKFEPVVRVCGG